MEARLFEAISSGAPGIAVTVSAQDLRRIVSEMVADERMRLEAEARRSREQFVITADEAARLLGTTKSTLWRWAKEGYLVPKKIGWRVYYRRSDIEKINEPKKTD